MMRHSVLFALVVVMVWEVSAEIALGVDVDTRLEREHWTPAKPDDAEVYTTRFGFHVSPSLIIVPASRVEVVPTIGLGTTVWARSEEEPDGERHRSDGADVSGGGGCGLFFRIVESKPLRLGLGPDVFFRFTNSDSDDEETFRMGIGGRLNLDFLITPRFFIRMSPRLACIDFHKRWDGGGSNNEVTFFDIESRWTPRLGFFFVLGG